MIDQAVIVVCGTASVWLSQDPRFARRRWACIVGISAQPFWLYSTWQAQQWGMFALAFVYSAAWARGIYSHWITPPGSSKDAR